MKYLLFLILLIVLASCSPAARLTRLLKRHPELIKTETVTKSDTFIKERVRVDTFVNLISWTDTVTRTIEKERLIIRLQRIHDTLKMTVQAPADTVIVVKQQTTATAQGQPKTWETLLKWIVLILMIYALISFIKKKIFKPD